MSFPAGWYDDGSGTQRWWDGTGWTEHVGEAVATVAPEAPAASAAQALPTPPSQTATYYPPQYAPQPGATNGLAIAALVLGILGFGVIAVIFGHIALGQIKRQPHQQGRGLAIAGLVLGYIVLAFWVIVFGIAIIVGMLGMFNTSTFR